MGFSPQSDIRQTKVPIVDFREQKRAPTDSEPVSRLCWSFEPTIDHKWKCTGMPYNYLPSSDQRLWNLFVKICFKISVLLFTSVPVPTWKKSFSVCVCLRRFFFFFFSLSLSPNSSALWFWARTLFVTSKEKAKWRCMGSLLIEPDNVNFTRREKGIKKCKHERIYFILGSLGQI